MRRALTLIIVLTVVCMGSGLWLDRWQTAIAQKCLLELETIRQQILAGELSEAQEAERYLAAIWQHENGRLKCLISHQYIHAVDVPLLHLMTALEQGWRDEALCATDELFAALKDVAEDHRASFGNVV